MWARPEIDPALYGQETDGNVRFVLSHLTGKQIYDEDYRLYYLWHRLDSPGAERAEAEASRSQRPVPPLHALLSRGLLLGMSPPNERET